MRKRIHLWLAVMIGLLILCGLGWLIVPGLNRGSLMIEAQLVRPSGETQAVARETFYLLDADMIMLAMSEGNASSPLRERVYREHPNLGMVAKVMDARRRNAYSLGAEVMPFMENSKPLWEAHIVQSVQADAQGRALFRNLKPGDYWLLGRIENRAGAAFWNQRVSVSRGRNQLTLDQNNALYVKRD